MLLLLLACTSAGVKVGADDTGVVDETDADTDVDADTDSDTDVDADTDTDTDTDTDVDTNPFTGEWTGIITIEVPDPTGEIHPVCEGEGTVTVDDAGAFTGDGTCASENGPGDILVSFDGAIAADGTYTGIVTQETREVTEYTLEGTSEPQLGFVWAGEIMTPDGFPVEFEASFVTE